MRGGRLAHHADSGPLLHEQADTSGLKVRRDRPERAGDGELIGGGAVPGDGERRGIRPSGRHQQLGQIDGPGLHAEDDQAARRRRVRCQPTDVGRVDDPHIGAGIGGQRDARVGRHGGSRRHARHDFEPGTRLRADRDVAGRPAEDERISLVQPDHQLARLRRPRQHPRILLGTGGIRDHRAGAQQVTEPAGQLRAAHHQVRLREKLGGTDRQQPLIPGPRAHEGHEPGLRRRGPAGLPGRLRRRGSCRCGLLGR